MRYLPTTFQEAASFLEGSLNQHRLAFRLLLLFVGMVYLAACSTPMPTATPPAIAPTPEDIVAAATPLPTDAPTEAPTAAPAELVEPTATPTETPTETPVPEPEDWRDTVTVEGDFFVRGNPAAPIRLVDYSDFM